MRPRSRFLLVVILLAAAGCATRPPITELDRAELARQLDAALGRHKATGATYSARIIELPSREELYLLNPDEPYIPASNMKLPVTAAALDRFDPDHAFKTWLALDGDDLWIIGTGDPATGDPRLTKAKNTTPVAMFDDWAEALRKNGVREVRGNLFFYDGVFDDQRVHPLWSRSFLTDWYAAPVSGLNFNDNCIDVSLKPTKPGEPAAYEVMPPQANFHIDNRTTTSVTEHDPQITRDPNANRFTISGPVTRAHELESKPVVDPGEFFASAFRARLQEKGIRIEGQTLRSATPLRATLEPPAEAVVATHQTTLREILPRVNKNSQNLFAEALCKYLGRQYAIDIGSAGASARGSWQAGGQAVRAYLQGKGIDDAGFTLTDGSGLARQNRVTTRMMSDLLASMHAHRHRDVFYESLSVAGKDGTLARRLPDSQGRLHAKTGFISGVRALSGYVKTRSGRTLAFSIIFNNIPGPVRPYEALQDEACRILLKL